MHVKDFVGLLDSGIPCCFTDCCYSPRLYTLQMDNNKLKGLICSVLVSLLPTQQKILSWCHQESFVAQAQMCVLQNKNVQMLANRLWKVSNITPFLLFSVYSIQEIELHDEWLGFCILKEVSCLRNTRPSDKPLTPLHKTVSETLSACLQLCENTRVPLEKGAYLGDCIKLLLRVNTFERTEV